MRALGTAPTVRVIATDPLTDPRWHHLATRPGAGLFTSPPWMAAVCGTYDFAASARIALAPGGKPVGGFAWVPVDDARGRRLLSLPFSDRADPLVPDTAIWDLVLDAAETGDTPFTLRCLDDSPAASAARAGQGRLHVAGEDAWHGTPLDAGVDELHGRISSQSRRNLAAADRAGVRVEVRDDVDAVRLMHGLHVRLRKNKYGLLAQPEEFFTRIWHEFAPDGHVSTLLARVGDEIVAAALFLEWNGVLYYKFGASLAEHLHLRPNDAIYWAGMRLGVDRGASLVDWGLSALSQPGLVRFKRKWASEERRLLTLRSGTDAPGPAQRELGAVLGELTALLTDDAVPDDVTARAGALLYRYFC